MLGLESLGRSSSTRSRSPAQPRPRAARASPAMSPPGATRCTNAARSSRRPTRRCRSCPTSSPGSVMSWAARDPIPRGPRRQRHGGGERPRADPRRAAVGGLRARRGRRRTGSGCPRTPCARARAYTVRRDRPRPATATAGTDLSNAAPADLLAQEVPEQATSAQAPVPHRAHGLPVLAGLAARSTHRPPRSTPERWGATRCTRAGRSRRAVPVGSRARGKPSSRRSSRCGHRRAAVASVAFIARSTRCCDTALLASLSTSTTRGRAFSRQSAAGSMRSRSCSATASSAGSNRGSTGAEGAEVSASGGKTASRAPTGSSTRCETRSALPSVRAPTASTGQPTSQRRSGSCSPALAETSGASRRPDSAASETSRRCFSSLRRQATVSKALGQVARSSSAEGEWRSPWRRFGRRRRLRLDVDASRQLVDLVDTRGVAVVRLTASVAPDVDTEHQRPADSCCSRWLRRLPAAERRAAADLGLTMTAPARPARSSPSRCLERSRFARRRRWSACQCPSTAAPSKSARELSLPRAVPLLLHGRSATSASGLHGCRDALVGEADHLLHALQQVVLVLHRYEPRRAVRGSRTRR